MIQQALNGMITLLLAKFVLNDVPHALGLAGKERHVYTIYRMRCPRTDPHRCEYEYSVQLYTEPYAWETCPVCGYGAPFKEFVWPKETA